MLPPAPNLRISGDTSRVSSMSSEFKGKCHEMWCEIQPQVEGQPKIFERGTNSDQHHRWRSSVLRWSSSVAVEADSFY
ncbi:unnamed protein product [Pieris macdunnoughi]|uniref:Uncharacterized protein n=1 Tax=Pieris macdunnoughi TaxID=345717 RepID=A0A821WER2_9NEOP|nr:unnamed protein product [Pieris macdunnoughi]